MVTSVSRFHKIMVYTYIITRPTNAGGMRAVKYGVTRDYVRGLTVVLPDGEILTLGGKIAKNSSGYSLRN